MALQMHRRYHNLILPLKVIHVAPVWFQVQYWYFELVEVCPSNTTQVTVLFLMEHLSLCLSAIMYLTDLTFFGDSWLANLLSGVFQIEIDFRVCHAFMLRTEHQLANDMMLMSGDLTALR